jgi:hypothetical protein
MFSVPTSPAALKTRSPEGVGVCPRCKGLGMSPGGPSADPEPCGACDSTGRVVYAERRPRSAPAVLYVATQAQDVIDVGTCPLQDFVARLVADWPALRGDVVCWLIRDELCPEPRAVAVIAPGRDGKPRTTWL